MPDKDEQMIRPGVLIVSASTGTGHMRAAEALHEAAAARHPHLAVEHVDLLATAPRWVRSVYGAGYEMVAMKAPRLWKGIYHVTDGERDHAHWGPLARRLVFREFRRRLQSGSWGVVLSTHFLPSQLAAGRPGFPPVAMVITDFTLHRYWVQPRVRRYFVATETMAAELRGRIPGARVEASGIPVGPAFAAAPPPAEARVALGLDPDRPVVLVMGGGLGIGVEEAADAALAGSPAHVQVVAVCGRNEEARAALAARGVPEARLKVRGFERGMERWLAAADVVATKPGGLTTSETLAMGKPLLLTRPIPGAEEGNTRAVVAEGAALAAFDDAGMRAAFARLFTEPGVLDRLSAAARRIGRPDAAERVIDAVAREYGVSAAA
jgi:processive 1,2-diacylglycerol beta-glucosyltransferase